MGKGGPTKQDLRGGAGSCFRDLWMPLQTAGVEPRRSKSALARAVSEPGPGEGCVCLRGVGAAKPGFSPVSQN